MMKKTLVTMIVMLSAAAGLHAWTASGNSRTEVWLAQPGYSLSYREGVDLSLNGVLDNGIQIKAGLGYVQDEEAWNDSVTFKGIAKKNLELRKGETQLKIGNYYASLGRGLILNCLNDDLVKRDRELEGAVLSGAGGIFEAKALAGQALENTVRIDSRSYYGGEIKISALPGVDLGGAYLRANASGRPQDVNYNKPAEESYGGSAGLQISSLELYGEYDVRHTYGMLDPTLGWIGADDARGKGFYSAVGWAVSGVGIMIDYKDYKNMNGAVNAPPSCNRDGRLLNQAADEQGLQADFTISPRGSLEIHANYSTAGADQNGSAWEDTYVEARWEMSPRWVLRAEARARTEDSLEAEVSRRKYKGAGLECQWRYGRQNSLSLKVDGDRFDNRYIFGSLKYDEIRAELGWVPLGFINLYGQIEISDKRLPEYENQRSWGRAGAAINIGQSQKLDISAGQNKGGLVCSGGYCRYEPPFKGFKAVWFWSF